MGKYVESILTNNERVIHETNDHWQIYVPGLCLVPVFGIGIPVLIYEYFRSKNNEYAVTNRRVIFKKGIFSRQTFEMSLRQIESVMIRQSFWGRIFGYGTISLSGTGGTSPVFNSIANPLEFKKEIDQAVESQRGN